jgi:hypothetical protein
VTSMKIGELPKLTDLTLITVPPAMAVMAVR